MTRRVTSCVLAGAVIAVTGVVLFGGTTPTEEAVPFIEGLRQFLVPSSQGWPTAEVTYRIQYSNGGLLTVDEAAWFEQDRWQRGTPGATVYDEGSVRVIAFLEDPASGTRGGSGPAAWHARLLPGVPQRVEAHAVLVVHGNDPDRVRAEAIGERRYLAFLRGEPAGTFTLWPRGRFALIGNVGTVPRHRMRGVARTMIFQACSRAVDLHFEYVLLTAALLGTPRVMYETLGFRPVGEIRGFLRR